MKCILRTAPLAVTALLLSAAISTGPALAQTFEILHSFDGTDGKSPDSGLIQSTDGNLYGTTSGGGAYTSENDCPVGGCGTFFKVTSAGALTTLYSFCSQDVCSHGAGTFPSGLVQAANGDFYGTLYEGGATFDGSVFKITPGGALTTLYSFGYPGGVEPGGGLIQASDGYLYGVTTEGGAAYYGTIFKITSGGALTYLYAFCSQSGCADGAYPEAGLIQASNGDLYGTTVGPDFVDGTLFKITRSGTLTTLHIFNITDGQAPQASLIQASNGDLYGTTAFGGANNSGTIFKITSTGTLTTLYNFCSRTNSEGYCTDGAGPNQALVQATDGNFYGTTSRGGTDDRGSLFKITPSGTLTTLYNFGKKYGIRDLHDNKVLMQATDGNFYGTTSTGGVNGDGTVFRLSVGLGPFVETQINSGKVGAVVHILGSNLTGATSVQFNGSAADFTVVSAHQITATVPTGATSGTVEVATPGGTLKSNTRFTVSP